MAEPPKPNATMVSCVLGFVVMLLTQFVEAFPLDGSIPRYLHRDRDCIYGREFRRTVGVVGITEVISARKSPWQNPFAERLIGSIRRECTDHIIALGETHLRQALNEYAAYYNRSRPHQSLGGNAPRPRRAPISEPV